MKNPFGGFGIGAFGGGPFFHLGNLPLLLYLQCLLLRFLTLDFLIEFVVFLELLEGFFPAAFLGVEVC